MRPSPSLVLSGLVLPVLSLLGCAAPQAERARPASQQGKRTYAAEVLSCLPAEVPASFVIERTADVDRAAPLFEETRGVVLTTLSLYLGTGRWAGDEVEIGGGGRPSRAGTEDECRALREVAEGRPPPPWPGSGPEAGPLLVSGVVSYAYLPGGKSRPRVQVRLAALEIEVGADRKVSAAGTAEAAADYADIAGGPKERNPQEIARELTEQVARALRRTFRRGGFAPRRADPGEPPRRL